MSSREGKTRDERPDFGSGTPGDQGTYSGVGTQPDGGGAGLGEVVESGDGSPQDIAEAGGNPDHRNTPVAGSADSAEQARESYDTTEEADSELRPVSGDRNTARGPKTEDLDR
jgi:hypothetical protein